MTRLKNFFYQIFAWPMAIGWVFLLFVVGFATLGWNALRDRLGTDRQESTPVIVDESPESAPLPPQEQKASASFASLASSTVDTVAMSTAPVATAPVDTTAVAHRPVSDNRTEDNVIVFPVERARKRRPTLRHQKAQVIPFPVWRRMRHQDDWVTI